MKVNRTSLYKISQKKVNVEKNFALILRAFQVFYIQFIQKIATSKIFCFEESCLENFEIFLIYYQSSEIILVTARMTDNFLTIDFLKPAYRFKM